MTCMRNWVKRHKTDDLKSSIEWKLIECEKSENWENEEKISIKFDT